MEQTKNRRLIDIHSHILPGVDDGSQDMDMTRQMLRMAWSQGIRSIIATPHCGPDAKEGVTAADLLRLTADVQREAGKIDPEFHIYSGNELLYTDSIVERLEAGTALTLADTSYVLVEFYSTVSMRECVRAVRRLTAARYLPVIAHAERYPCLREKGALEELIQGGALIQINYRSLTGGLFDRDLSWVKRSVQSGCVHLFGTDMHNTGQRKPETEKAVFNLIRWVGEERADELIFQNPKLILENQYI